VSPALLTYAEIQLQLTNVIREVSADAMPPSNSGYALLTACEKAILRKWQALGAPRTSAVLVRSLPACSNRAFDSSEPMNDEAIDTEGNPM
jgi:hypothetical protein